MSRILLVSTSYPVAGEGEAAAGTFVRDFALALVEQGHQVEVIAPAQYVGRTQVAESLIENYFHAPRLPLSLLSPKKISDWPVILRTLRNGSNAVENACSNRRPDHIFALWTLPCGAWAKHSGKRHKIPYSTWALGSDIWSLGKIPVIRQLLITTLRQAKFRFADGHQLAAEVKMLAGVDCQFLPSSRKFAGNPLRKRAETPPYRFAFLGRWHVNKGIDILLEALQQLDEAVWPKIEAIRICGGGPLEESVQRSVGALRSMGRPVELNSYLDLAAAQALFEWTGFVLIPSRIESIPVVFSDALQSKRPVIATPVGDLAQLINSLQCGTLADKPTPAAFAQAIRQACEIPNQSLAQGLVTGAIAFDIDQAAQTFMKTIQR